MKRTDLTFTSAVLAGIVMSFVSLQPVHATVEPGWPAGTPNTCRNDTDGFMDFERGIEAVEIESTIPGVEFTTTQGINWRYGDIRTGNYNVYPYKNANYETNGNFFAWLGVTGDSGRITFTGGTASYVSVLVSTLSGVTLDAYDADGNFLATSGWATDNLGTRTMTRLTVEATNIAYVMVHDTGNYWLMDDLCTDAGPVCKPVPGRDSGDHGDKIDLVFVPDDDYGSPDDIDTWLPTFLENVNGQIDSRLGAQAPVTGNLSKFNFYYTEKQGSVDNSNCAEESSLPDGLIQDCTFADAIVVLHETTFGDCSSTNRHPNVYSAEGSMGRSFIHETGHGIFGLADEYDGSPACSTYYFQPDPNPNIWETEAACRTDATNEGWDPDDCQMFTTCRSDWWKVGTTAYIMEDGTYFANGWGDPAARRITWVLDQYQSHAQAASSGSRSIWLSLNMSNNPLALLGKGFVVDSPPDYLPGTYDFMARVVSTSEATLAEYGFGNPRRKYAEWDYIGPVTLDSVDFTLVLPYFYNGSRVDIFDSVSGELLISVDISEFVDPSNQSPVANAGGPYTGTVSSPITFDASGSFDPDGEIVSYQWDWDDDGTYDDTTDSPIMMHGYDVEFSGTVRLRVVDNDGLSATDTASVDVSRAAAGHFLCYRAKTAKGTTRFEKIPGVSLADQFDEKKYDVKKLQSFCNPADKNGEGISDPETHLKAYLLKLTRTDPPQAKFQKLTNIRVENQLGTLFLDATKPRSLLVPTAKSLQGPANPPDPQAHNVDHYKCYQVKVSKGTPKFPKGLRVTLADQFIAPTVFDVKRPTKLCTPVSKNGEGIKNQSSHLLCYKLARAKGRCAQDAPQNAGGACRKEEECGGHRRSVCQPGSPSNPGGSCRKEEQCGGETGATNYCEPGTSFCSRQPKFVKIVGVYTNNQFGPEQLDIKRPDELCVPSLMTLPSPTTTTTTTSSTTTSTL